MEQITLTGRITHTVYHSPNGFFVGKLAPVILSEDKIQPVESKPDTVVGEITKENALSSHDIYTFVGTWESNGKWGAQFKFTTFYPATPCNKSSIMGYLDKCMQIGPERAKAIWEILGEDSIAMIKQDPSCISCIPGITEERAKQIQRDLKEREETEQITLKLSSSLGGHGIPDLIVKALVKQYKKKAMSVVMSDPFGVLLPLGVEFPIADKIYLSAGHNPLSTGRMSHLFGWSFEKDQTGSTWVEVNGVCREMLKYLGKSVSEDDLWDAVNRMWKRGLIEMRNGSVPGPDGTESSAEFVSPKRIAEREDFISKQTAHMVADLIHSGSPTPWPEELPDAPDGTSPDEGQIECYRKATQARIGLITGSPGSGKTFLIGRIAEALQGNCWICALANKAVLRLKQTLNRQGLGYLNIPVTTIHSMLGGTPVGKDGWGFTHDAGNTLDIADASVIIVDEASMVDNFLLGAILEAMPQHGRLLLVGDPDQLSPIGRGAPFRDLLEAGDVPRGHLTDIKRNKGMIVEACAKIRQKSELFRMGHDFNNNMENLQLVSTGVDTDDFVDAVIAIDRHEENLTRRGYRVSPDDGGRDLVRSDLDMQLIVALNEMGTMSRKRLNERLREHFNPRRRGDPDNNKLRVGDKVICLKNGYLSHVSDGLAYVMGLHDDKSVKPELRTDALRVSNGDLFFVVHVSHKFIVVEGDSGRGFIPLCVLNKDDDIYRVISPTYHVEARRLKESRRQEYQGMQEEKDISLKLNNNSTLSSSDFDLAYAITCHKFQGSSAPVTIVALDPVSTRVADRHWIYTAISRAESRCYLVGDPRVIRTMVLQSNMWSRRTFLTDAILEYLDVFRDDTAYAAGRKDRAFAQDKLLSSMKHPADRQPTDGCDVESNKICLYVSRYGVDLQNKRAPKDFEDVPVSIFDSDDDMEDEEFLD